MVKRKESVDLDMILNEVGSLGRYQIQTLCILVVPMMLTGVYNTQYVFAAGDVDYRCLVPQCESSPPVFEAGEWGKWVFPPGAAGKCQQHVPVGTTCEAESFHANNTQRCSAWIYENNNTIVAEFGLACENWKRTLVGTIHSTGLFAALCITGFMSDTFGRRNAFILTAVSRAVTGLARAFSTNYVQYLVLELLDATAGSGTYSCGYILALEMVSLHRRVLVGNMMPCSFAMGQVLMALIAWTFPYWRLFILVTYTPSILFLLYYFILGESIRWLLSKGRKKEAAKILFKVARVNKKKLSPATVKLLTEEHIEADPSQKSTDLKPEKKKVSIAKQVWRSRVLRSRVCICSFWWVSVTFIYYGLSINSVSLAGNMYLNFILTAMVEIPGYTLSVLTLDRFGRKGSIMTGFFICSVSLLTLPFLPTDLPAVTMAFTLLGKLFISMVFGSIYVYTSEMLPTPARQSLLNLCSMAGRCGQIVAPMTPLLSSYMRSLPYLIFGGMAACAGGLMMLTPETLRIRLPDTVQQAESIAVAPHSRRRHTDPIVD